MDELDLESKLKLVCDRLGVVDLIPIEDSDSDERDRFTRRLTEALRRHEPHEDIGHTIAINLTKMYAGRWLMVASTAPLGRGAEELADAYLALNPED